MVFQKMLTDMKNKPIIMTSMDDSNVRVNSLKAWFLAARPKTLTGAAVPVMI